MSCHNVAPDDAAEKDRVNKPQAWLTPFEMADLDLVHLGTGSLGSLDGEIWSDKYKNLIYAV